MATKVIPSGYADCALALTLSGDPEPILLTFGVSLDDPLTQTIVDAVFDACKVTPGLRTEISSSYTMSSLRMYEGNDTTEPPTVWESTTAAAACLGAGAPLPQNCAVIATKRTATAGRAYKGRMYIPGIGEGAVDAVGVIQPATVTAFQTAVTAFRANVNAVSGIGNLHIIHTKPKVGPTPEPTFITSMVVQSKIATQRRRLRK